MKRILIILENNEYEFLKNLKKERDITWKDLFLKLAQYRGEN